jgi:hypothetical protein
VGGSVAIFIYYYYFFHHSADAHLAVGHAREDREDEVALERGGDGGVGAARAVGRDRCALATQLADHI